jgi:hypothetical protein
LASNILARSNALDSDVARLLYEASLLERISKLWMSSVPPESPDTPDTLNPPDPDLAKTWVYRFPHVANRFVQVQARVRNSQAAAELWVGIVSSFLLPTLLGTAGAVAYVLRATSDQIRTTTFSRTSPIRNLVRIALGALAGVVVGLFNGISAGLTLSPLALSFLAGYGVEALFSMFDGLISKFREAAPLSPPGRASAPAAAPGGGS